MQFLFVIPPFRTRRYECLGAHQCAVLRSHLAQNLTAEVRSMRHLGGCGNSSSSVRCNHPNLTHRDAKLSLLKRYKLLADINVVERRVYDYGRGTVSPASRLPHCTVVALAMLAPPVINDLESQNRSVPFPLIWVKGFVPVPTATVDRLATTKPP